MNNFDMQLDANNLKLLKNLYILVVEDDSAVLEDIKSTIEIFCNNVYTATNGKEALEIIHKCSIDMVLTDYVMPYMNGYEFCQTVRETNKNIPIVIISNYSDNEKLLKSIPLNLTEYLIKPIDYTSLTTVLSKMVQKLEESGLVCEQITKELKYNHITKVLKMKEEILSLTKNETLLLELFLKNKNSLVNHTLISYNINDGGLSNQAIKNLIHRLRVKIGKELIVNIKDMGYMLVPTHE
jgi:DNA-binding response OmpR family regulator